MFAQINTLDFLQSHFHRDGSHEQEKRGVSLSISFLLSTLYYYYSINLLFYEMKISSICEVLRFGMKLRNISILKI